MQLPLLLHLIIIIIVVVVIIIIKEDYYITLRQMSIAIINFDIQSLLKMK